MSEALLADNLAWAAGRHGDRDFFTRQAAPRQAEHLWIGCACSRLSGQDLTGLPPGAIFALANLGNLALSQDIGFLSGLQYALEVLKVRHVVVCGHYGCGAMGAALSDPAPGLVDHWLAPVRALAWRHAQDLETILDPAARANRLCELNVAAQLAQLAANPLVHETWRRGQPLSLHGWIHSAADGLLRDLETSVSSPRQAMALVGGPMDQVGRRRGKRKAS
ncbi:carbonic anhydrase [Caulobacter sp. Root1455]|uniref:carbonic anhydrase n=1 Tax=unclassified Caulobacter TaxID=2648921 RepID=UPI0006F8F8EF|nr:MULTISPECIES: carbonic anhydrase [unclassified Caulobacter]KQY26469.1 carbonic anhydrase [Caulobacter sp. Root487D2Y]KQY91448.1 carbonic anhydrase [Caulobacter sp. Root1455]